MINVDLLYPVGSIYLSIKSKNPGEVFGGVWERIAKGRAIVGVDEADSDFSAANKTGGEKEHTLTIDEMPKHSHKIKVSGSTTGGYVGTLRNNASDGPASGFIEDEGGGQPHNNVQPYFTCYIFVRTA
ncbi:putative truncated prophage LambdaSa1 minor structural protein [Mycoplasma sp. CAG:877]|nr:putative truncated prophage LambdaSa1 minor structural protein [Mycoplasma sp. CAG:877]